MPLPYESGPAASHAAVTPSDSTTFNPPFWCLRVGTGGTVIVEDRYGTVVSYANVANGERLEIVGVKVKAATDAADI
jgi:hypothetical protein